KYLKLHKEEYKYKIEKACETLGVSRGGYYHYLNRKPSVFRQEFLYIIIVTFPHFYRALEKEHKASPLTVQAGRPA
ncbi:MAG: hypothetical protein PHT39_09990, partial [Sphaerochaetaceae bacterium]|nr:hypothetical protein [Sphaerochaetaceae bacterium]